MIDTLNMTVRHSGYNPFEVMRYANQIKDGIYTANGGRFAVGSIDNYKIYSDKNGVRLSGSIAKYARGENVSTPTRKDIAEGLQRLSDTLHLDVGGGVVNRVDIASTLNTINTPSFYLDGLISYNSAGGTKRDDETLYFFNPSKILCFYNKAAEMSQKGLDLPKAARGRNLLRYEMRLIKNIHQQLGLGSLRVADLTKQDIWEKQVNLWAREYKQVVKVGTKAISEATTHKQLLSALLCDLLTNYAPPDYISDVQRITKETMSRKERYRANKAISELCLLNCDERYIELDFRIEQTRAAAVA